MTKDGNGTNDGLGAMREPKRRSRFDAPPQPSALLRQAMKQGLVPLTADAQTKARRELFVGNIGNEVTDELLSHSFGRYPSLARAKVIRNKHTNKSKGFAFISFMDPFDCAKALREMNKKYIGNRPCKLMKSTWNDRTLSEVRKKDKKKRKAQKQWGIGA